jgi:hypothetical protein
MYSGDEEENPPIDVTARTSTSRTLVISETRPKADETSPPQQDIGHPSPVVSPRASSPKRARTDQGKEPSLMTDSSATPRMDDVITFLAIFLLSNVSNFFVVAILQPLFFMPCYFSAFYEGICAPWYPIYRVPRPCQ